MSEATDDGHSDATMLENLRFSDTTNCRALTASDGGFGSIFAVSILQIAVDSVPVSVPLKSAKNQK